MCKASHDYIVASLVTLGNLFWNQQKMNSNRDSWPSFSPYIYTHGQTTKINRKKKNHVELEKKKKKEPREKKGKKGKKIRQNH